MKQPSGLTDFHRERLARIGNIHCPRIFEAAVTWQIADILSPFNRMNESDQQILNYRELIKGFRDCDETTIRQRIREALTVGDAA